MFIYCNNNLNDQSKTTGETKVNKSSTEKKKHNARRIETKAVGNYICTYLIDSKGTKVLLKKVPIFEDLLHMEFSTRLNHAMPIKSSLSMNQNENYTSDFYKRELLMRAAVLNMNIRSIL